MQFRILGPLEVEDDGRLLAIPTGRQRALLVLLLVHPNTVLTADRIVSDVWGEELPASGTKALVFHVSRLRAALAAGPRPGEDASCLVTDSGGYALRIDPEAIDAVRFERLVREGHEQLAGDPARAHSTILGALALWRGEPLLDVAYAEFAQAEIRRLEELRLGALEDRLEAELALGGHHAAIGELQSLLEQNPLRERLRGLLMLALYRAGRQAEALRVAGAGRRLLSEELGIDPSPELARLEASILAQDRALDVPALGRSVARRNPYKGLRAFGEADSADFFGREALVGHLVARLEEVLRGGRLLVVAGPSGSGKSSVVRAGLVPALRANALPGSAEWRIATMLPGSAPLAELVKALRAAGASFDAGAAEAAEGTGDLAPLLAGASRTLLVIDQFEELFVGVEPATRDRFLGGLLAALAAPETSLVVVAAIRVDFLHLPMAIEGVAELVRRGIELVPPLSRAELERAIVRPAQSVGAEVEPGLAAEMIADVQHGGAALPLLQYALTELFDRGGGQALTRDGYAAIGGAAGALERRADETWRSLTPERHELARQILLGLVTASRDGRVALRRVPRSDLESLAVDPNAVGEVLEALGRRGLIVFDAAPATGAPTVEIAHEALLQHWHRLAAWIDDLRDDLATRHRLADLAEEWEAAGRSAGFLASGSRLERLQAWARATRLRLTESERAYLAASLAEQERLARLDAERTIREHRAERRARLARAALALILAAALLVPAGFVAVLTGERQAAAEDQAVARARQLASGSIASLGTSRQLSVLLALAAADATADRGYVVEDAYDALQWALQEAQVPYPAGGAAPVGVRQAPGGRRGVYLVPPDELMRAGMAYIRRFRSTVALTADECRTYARTADCPALEGVAADLTLAVRTTLGRQPAAALALPPAGSLAGVHVRVLSELPASIAVPAARAMQGSGVTVDWDPEAGGDLASRLAARDPPDVAIVARPSSLQTAARAGWLMDLGGRVDFASLGADAGGYAMALGRADDSGGATGQFGLPVATSLEDLLWYPQQAFAEADYRAPTTLAELTDLAGRMRAAGRVPWCLGLEEATTHGTAAASWVEDLFLGAQGPADYDRLASGSARFGSQEVRVALESFGRFTTAPGAVLNGLRAAEHTDERYAALPMLLPEGPECWLFRGASTDRPISAYGTGPQLAAVPFPAPAGRPGTVLGRLYQVAVLHDRPEVRRFVEVLTGSAFQADLAASLGGAGIYPVRDVAAPPDALAVGQVKRLRAGIDADRFRVRIVDLVPDRVAGAFVDDVFAYLDLRSSGWLPTDSSSNMDFSADEVWDTLGRSPP